MRVRSAGGLSRSGLPLASLDRKAAERKEGGRPSGQKSPVTKNMLRTGRECHKVAMEYGHCNNT